MDAWAGGFWGLIIIQIVIFVGVIIGGLQLLNRKKSKKGSLISSIKTVFLAYLIFAIIFYLIPGDMGFSFAFFFLPIFSVIALILLEVFKLFKK
jgi:hypothetical protein